MATATDKQPLEWHESVRSDAHARAAAGGRRKARRRQERQLRKPVWQGLTMSAVASARQAQQSAHADTQSGLARHAPRRCRSFIGATAAAACAWSGAEAPEWLRSRPDHAQADNDAAAAAAVAPVHERQRRGACTAQGLMALAAAPAKRASNTADVFRPPAAPRTPPPPAPEPTARRLLLRVRVRTLSGPSVAARCRPAACSQEHDALVGLGRAGSLSPFFWCHV